MATDMTGQDDLKKNESGFLELLETIGSFESQFDLDYRFNLFEALGMELQEIRHSRFLGFLLDPANPHGLGERFLRAVLVTAVTDHPNSPISRLDAVIADLNGAIVYFERDHFDLAIEIRSLRLLFVVENKIRATERKDQLTDYKRLAREKYEDSMFLGCFLTPDGYQGEDETWGVMSYASVATELKRLTADGLPSAEVVVAIENYVRLIERKIVTSPKLIEACKTIYRQHRAAFDLIIQHGVESALGEAFKQFAEENSPSEQLVRTALYADRVFFIFESWRDIPNHVEADKSRAHWTSTFPVVLWFEIYKEKNLNLHVELGPLPLSVNRVDFLKRFPSSWGKRSPTEHGKYTRMLKHSVKLPVDHTVEDLVEAMKGLWGKAMTWNAEEVVRHAFQDPSGQTIAP